MYNYNYYIEVGFKRYTRRLEVDKEIYEEYSENPEMNLIWNSSKIRTKTGVISISADEILFIETVKETAK